MRAHSYCLASINRSPASATRHENSSHRSFAAAHSSSVISRALRGEPLSNAALSGRLPRGGGLLSGLTSKAVWPFPKP